MVLFVADGLRSRMVDEATAPAMAAMAREGVYLRNSHALFPTFTTANASAMATGHMLGDTGDFSNTIYAGFAVPGAAGSVTPFLESDPVLADVDEHFAGNYLDEATILKLAREAGLLDRGRRQDRADPDLRSHQGRQSAKHHRRRCNRQRKRRATLRRDDRRA